MLNPRIGEFSYWESDGAYDFRDLVRYLDGLEPPGGTEISRSARGRLLTILERLIPLPPTVDESHRERLKKLARHLKDLSEQIAHSSEQLKNPLYGSDLKSKISRTLKAQRRDLGEKQSEFDKGVEILRKTDAIRQRFSDKEERQILKNRKDAYYNPRADVADEPWKEYAQKVFWRILAAAESVLDWSDIEQHFDGVSKRTGERFEIERLRFLWEHGPDRDKVFVGQHEFEGYLVFIFGRKDRAFLECPKLGNALYVTDAGEWRVLSRKSKTELTRHPRVRRIPHLGGAWKLKVKEMLLDERVIAPTLKMIRPFRL